MKGKESRLLTVVIVVLLLVAFAPQAGQAKSGLIVGWHGIGQITVLLTGPDSPPETNIETQFTFIRGLPDDVTQYITASIPGGPPSSPIDNHGLLIRMLPVHVVTWYYDGEEIAQFESSLAMQTNVGGVFSPPDYPLPQPWAFNWMSNSYKLIWSKPFRHGHKKYDIKKLFPNGFGYSHIGNNNPEDPYANPLIFPYASTGMIVSNDSGDD